MARYFVHSLRELVLTLPDVGPVPFIIGCIGQKSARGSHRRDRVVHATAHDFLTFGHSGDIEQRKRKLELRADEFRLGALCVHAGAFAVCD
jgi:hypothetical protein